MMQQLDCSGLKTHLADFEETMCFETIGGWTENLWYICLQLPFTFIMTVLGVVVVQRYKVDVPRVNEEKS